MLESILSDIVIFAKPALFNLYYAGVTIPIGFVLALLMAVARNSRKRRYRLPAKCFIYTFRGSPLFIQFFMIYSLILALNISVWQPLGIDQVMLSPLFIGPTVLILNTTAYSAEIFFGAMRTTPKGEVEAANAYGMSVFQRFRRVILPNTLRLGWPAYSNEMVFLFHATALVYLTLPVIDQQKDLMNKAGELFETDYNLFLHFGVAGGYFLVISMFFFWIFARVDRYLNRHLPSPAKKTFSFRLLR